MNELEIFESSQFGSIRTITINNEPYFVGKDVAEILGYERPTKAVNDHVDPEDIDAIPIQDSIGRMQNTPIINESGLYSLILSSKLPTAKQFKHWVTSEVLPSIRKNGSFNTVPQGKELLALAVLEANRTIEAQNAQIEEMKPHAVLGKAITTANTSILVGDFAKILKQNGVDIGANRFFEWLRQNGYLIKRKGTDWNLPTQKSMDAGLFEVKESVHIDGNGCNKITRTPKITGKGQQYFINKLLTMETGRR